MQRSLARGSGRGTRQADTQLELRFALLVELHVIARHAAGVVREQPVRVGHDQPQDAAATLVTPDEAHGHVEQVVILLPRLVAPACLRPRPPSRAVRTA